MNNFTRFLKHFAVIIIIFIVMLGAFGLIFGSHIAKARSAEYDSPNTQRVYGDKRVFDYGDRLTEEQEAKLEELIHKRERLTGSDIVIISLEESLKGFADEYEKKYNYKIYDPSRYVMLYADEFWETNKFGYDQPQILDGTPNSGDGVCLVDNNFREPETGRKYTWMSTTGKAERLYSEEMIDHALDMFYLFVDKNFYLACVTFINVYTVDMTGGGNFSVNVLAYFPLIVVFVIVFFVYMGVNWKSKAGKRTITETTYIEGGKASFPVSEDTFLRKTVSQRHIDTSSGGGRSYGGGGGGHHSSGGGGSHGGGGHSR